MDELPISGGGVGWEGGERKESPSGGISLTLCAAQQTWITHSSWRRNLQRGKASSPSGPHCRHLVCICTPDWSQPFAITWDKPSSLPQFPRIKHKGSTFSPTSLSCLFNLKILFSSCVLRSFAGVPVLQAIHYSKARKLPLITDWNTEKEILQSPWQDLICHLKVHFRLFIYFSSRWESE